MKYLKSFNESNIPQKTINTEGYDYVINLGEIPKPGEYGYLDGLIVKVLPERTYPTAKEEGDLDSYENVWNVEVINKSAVKPYLGPDKNYHGKVTIPTSYHLSHFKRGGKVVETNNPDIVL